jgi:hypothetical protein
MFGFTKEEQDILEKDQKANPQCNYSVNMTKTCRDQNGEFVCETIRHLQRVCPGKKPVTIYNQNKQYSGTDSDRSSDSFFPLFGGFKGQDDRGFEHEEFFNPFNFAEDLMNKFGFGIFGENLQEKPSAPHFPQFQLPPHYEEKSGTDAGSSLFPWKEKKTTPTIKGQVTGPVEEV